MSILFKSVDTKEEKVNLLDFFYDKPRFLRFYNSLLIDVNRWLPSVGYSFYSMDYRNDETAKTTYYFGNAQAGPLSTTISEVNGDFDKDEFLKGWKQFSSMFNADVFTGRRVFAETLSEFYKCNCKAHTCYCFYMTQQQRDDVFNVEDFNLSNDYSLEKPNDENSIKIHNHWVHAKSNDPEFTKARLKSLPSFCIKANDEPVSWMSTLYFGQFAGQFTIAEHRRKGLAAVIERNMQKYAIQKNMVPFKEIDWDNFEVLRRARNDQFWTEQIADGLKKSNEIVWWSRNCPICDR